MWSGEVRAASGLVVERADGGPTCVRSRRVRIGHGGELQRVGAERAVRDQAEIVPPERDLVDGGGNAPETDADETIAAGRDPTAVVSIVSIVHRGNRVRRTDHIVGKGRFSCRQIVGEGRATLRLQGQATTGKDDPRFDRGQEGQSQQADSKRRFKSGKPARTMQGDEWDHGFAEKAATLPLIPLDDKPPRMGVLDQLFPRLRSAKTVAAWRFS